MDPLTLIVSSLAAGAVASAKSTVESIVKDSYEGIKAFIKKKFGSKVTVEDMEKNPNSESKRGSLKEDLENSGAAHDQELLEMAKNLIEVVKQHAPDTKVTGVNIEDVEAEFLKINKVESTGTGVNVSKSKFTGGIDIGEVKSGGNSSNPS